MIETNGIGAIRKLDYVIILCDDIPKMKEFYSDLFGFTVEEETKHWVAYRLGGLFLGLRKRGRFYDGVAGPDASASMQISFRVPPADVDRAWNRLEAKGVYVIEPPTNQDWTHRTLFFRDPENNILEIFADIHPDDTLPAPSGVHLIKDP